MDDFTKRQKELSRKYALAKKKYQQAKQTGDEELIEKARKKRDNARKRFQESLGV